MWCVVGDVRVGGVESVFSEGLEGGLMSYELLNKPTPHHTPVTMHSCVHVHVLHIAQCTLQCIVHVQYMYYHTVGIHGITCTLKPDREPSSVVQMHEQMLFPMWSAACTCGCLTICN